MSSSDSSDRASQKPIASRSRKRVFGCSAALLALIAFLCYIGVLGGNVREVDPGRLYRSSQLTGNGYEALSATVAGNSLNSVIGRDHIGTILNLRGGSWKDARYRDEVEICKANRVAHVDDAFSARSLPSPEVLLKMLDVFDHAKYPLLVHCQAGSDRTGLACTLYAVIYMKEALDTAENSQLTWRYGHFRFSNTRPMDQFFDLYRTDSHGLNLRDWIIREYPSVYASSTSSLLQQHPPAK